MSFTPHYRPSASSYSPQDGKQPELDMATEALQVAPRPIRGGDLQSLLDEEFGRNYRFEGLSDFIQDLKGLVRKVISREGASEQAEFLAGTRGPNASDNS